MENREQEVTEQQHASAWVRQTIDNDSAEYRGIFFDWTADANPEVARVMEQIVAQGQPEYVEPFLVSYWGS